MPTKNQHYVPRVYLKSWETTVYSKREPKKPFQGVYKYEGRDYEVGDGITRDRVLSGANTYTIGFEDSFIAQHCPQIRDDFGTQIESILRRRNVKAFLDGVQLATVAALGDSTTHIENWEFRYDSSNRIVSPKSKNAIKNQIQDIKCYVLEEAFSTKVEDNWETTYDDFIKSAMWAPPDKENNNLRVVQSEIAERMVQMTMYMMFRNPFFDCLGAYSLVNEIVFNPFIENAKDDIHKDKWEKHFKRSKRDIWLVEIAKALFQQKDGAYHNMFNKTRKGCIMALFEIDDSNEGQFITSDNPAFWYLSKLDPKNNGIYFPLSPKHLLELTGSHSGDKAFLDYRIVTNKDIRNLNIIIANSATNTIVSNRRYLGYLL